jgi:hypothetical protein
MSLTFIREYFVLFFVSIIFGIVLSFFISSYGPKILKYKNYFDLKITKILFFVAALLFLFFGYLTKPVYYNPKTIGTLGDDYFQMSEAVKKKGILQAQHIMKPYITEKFIILAEKLGILKQNDPLYLEKSVIVASFPVRVLTVLGLLSIFIMAFLSFESFYIALLFLFFIGTSFSVWSFGIMHNSLGAAIAMTMLTCFSAEYFFKKPAYFKALLFSVITGLCVFTHSAIGYFCIGIFLYMVYWVLIKNEVDRKIKFNYFIVFCIGALGVAIFYYYVLSSYFGTYKISDLIRSISDSSYENNIAPGPFLKRLYNSIMQYSLNLFNVWVPENIFERILIMLQISGFLSALIITFKNIKKDNFIKNINFMLFFIIPVITVILGYLFLNCEFYHYLDVGTVSVLLFLLYFFFLFNENSEQRIKIGLSLSLVVISFFIYNIFSSRNVLAYRDINSIPIYANYNIIYENLKNEENKKAVFFTANQYQPYFYKGLETYYKKFNSIKRIIDFPKIKLILIII